MISSQMKEILIFARLNDYEGYLKYDFEFYFSNFEHDSFHLILDINDKQKRREICWKQYIRHTYKDNCDDLLTQIEWYKKNGKTHKDRIIYESGFEMYQFINRIKSYIELNFTKIIGVKGIIKRYKYLLKQFALDFKQYLSWFISLIFKFLVS